MADPGGRVGQAASQRPACRNNLRGRGFDACVSLPSGAFNLAGQSQFTLTGVTDGLSHTAAFSGRLFGAPGSTDPRKATFQTFDPLLSWTQVDALLFSCARVVRPASGRAKGGWWLRGDSIGSHQSKTIRTNGRTCSNAGHVQPSFGTAGSVHAGGFNVLRLDGSAAFQEDSVSPAV